MHLRNADTASVKDAVAQCVETGFEKIILSFGSGFNIEDTSITNLDRFKELTDYAHRQGITLGGYSLLASRKVDNGNDVVMPEGKQPVFGNSPCLGSAWGEEYLRWYMGKNTFNGMDACASCRIPGRRGRSHHRTFERTFAALRTAVC
jgi:hypothetical protein